MSSQSADDVDLKAELACAYDRSGDVLGNLADSAVDGAQTSLPLYKKALALRMEVARSKPNALPAREALARAHEHVGMGYLGVGRTNEAVANFESALKIVGERPVLKAEMYDRLSTGYAMMGNLDRATNLSDQALSLDRRLQSAHMPLPDQLLVRVNRARGIILHLQGRNQEAIPWLKRSADLLTDMMEKNSLETYYRRSYATMLPQMADAYDEMGQHAQANAVWASALSRLEKIGGSSVDPQMVLSLAYAWRKIAWNHYHAHLEGKDQKTGEKEMALSLEASGRLAARPNAGASELCEYSDTLVHCPFPKLQDYPRALHFALRANELSRFQNPLILDTLAWAYYRTGDTSHAISTMENAWALLPNTSGSVKFRNEFQKALREFRSSKRSGPTL